MLFLFMYVCMCALLAPEWLDEFYSYLVFKSSSIIDQCSVNMDIPSPKIEDLHMGLKNQIAVSQAWLLRFWLNFTD
jgi:hypothetical protein